MTFTYALRKGNKKNYKTVYIGTTNNPKRRNAEHSKSGKNYTYMKVTSGRISKAEAGRREARNIKSFTKATGRRPKHNQTSSGKFERWH